MNNILTLYDMEFKRIYKIYFTLIGILLASNIGATLFSIYSVPSRTSDMEGNPITVNVLKSEEGIRYIYEYLIGDLTSITKMAVAFSVLLCLLYSLVIWYRDYFSKSKTIATLLMLPQKRFNIYIAKLITVTSMIFGVISVQFLFWFIDLVIIKAILNVNVDGFTNVFETILANQNRFSNLIFIQPIDFLMIDVFGVILAVVVIFTGVLMERSYKKIGIILGGGYIFASIILYICLTAQYAQYVDNYYGTPKAYVEEQLAAGKDVILEIEVQGALKVKEKNPQALLLFVTPPSAEELKHRLIDRGTETMDVINDRMRRAAEESEIMDHYQYLVINDDLDTCVKEVHQLIQSEHLKVSENLDLVADIQKELKEMKGE